MSKRIRETLYAQTSSDGSTIYVLANIDCDTASDLPAVNAFSGLTLLMGSRAHDIDQNAWYEMKDGGTWVLQDAGTAGYTKAEVDTLLLGKQDTLTFDTVPTVASTNPVTSGGILNWVYGSAPTTISANSDLNDYYNIGTYRATSNAIAATLANCPTQNGFRLEVVSTIAAVATGYQIQRLYPNNSNGEFFMRRRLSAGSGNWGDWFRFAGTVLSPFPADCPFTCDLAYFVDSAVSVTINGTTFTKSTTGYAIGMVIAVNVPGGTGTCTGVLFMSPVSADAVRYTPYHDTWNPSQGDKTVTYDGVTWYCANPGGAVLGDFRNGTYSIPVYPTELNWSISSPVGISESDLLDVLAYVNAANRSI